ncbi:hypothetical protein ACFC08_17680 [Streptomyces sp. NPDC056112]|uniref:hypothetical protein n=1 Tax=Streptomyces sp. NPDC056112 TaxID=3345715 RepID=UPI0035DCE394
MVFVEPAGLGERGRQLWRESLATWSLTPAHLVLLEEACRVADRLELLDSIVRAGLGGVNPDVEDFADIAAVLAESRQQQGAFKALLAEIRQGQKGSAGPASKQGQKAGGSGVADLSKRIAERKRQAEG